MPTTFANTIDGNEILAKRSQCDYAGADIQTTYATKSEVTTGLASKQDTISDLATIRSGAAAGATAVQPGDLATVATTGDYDDLSNKPSIPAPQVNADWNAVSGAAEILNKPVIPEGVPTYTAAEEGKVLGVVEVSGSPALDWVQGGGGDSTLPSYYDRVEQKTLDGSMASIVLGPMLTRQTQTNTFNQRALAYTTLNSILLYGRGYAGMWLMDFVDRGYVHLSRSGVWADNPTYAIWFPCTANSSNILTPINTSVYLKTKSTYNWSYAGNYSHYVYTSTGLALTWSLARDAQFPAPFSATGEIDTTLFDQVGDWSSITMPQPWQWALAFQDSDGNFTNCGGDSSENYTGLSVAYPVSYYNVKLMSNGGLSENRGAGLYVTNPLPSSSSSDENKVLTVNSSGSPEWATPSGGGSVTDVEVNGTSVVNASGVAEVTVPAQVNADWNSSSGASEILNKPTIPSGAQLVPAATSADADKVLTVDSQGTPAWSTPAAGGVTDVEVDGTSVVSGGVASITMPTVDQTYNSASTDAQSGVAVAGALSTKQDTISDLATIRSGAADGATAVQPGDLATVATTGSYSDLTGTPTILPYKPVVAGTGVRIVDDTANNRIVVEADETVLWESQDSAGHQTVTLSESKANFERIKILVATNNGTTYGLFHEIPSNMANFNVIRGKGATNVWMSWIRLEFTNNTTLTVVSAKSFNFGAQTATSWANPSVQVSSTEDIQVIWKVVGINRVASN